MGGMLPAAPCRGHALVDKADNAQEEQDSLVEEDSLLEPERLGGQPCLGEGTPKWKVAFVVAEASRRKKLEGLETTNTSKHVRVDYSPEPSQVDMQCRLVGLVLAPGWCWAEEQEDSRQDCSDLGLPDDERTLESGRLS